VGSRDKLFKTDKHKRGSLALNHTLIPLSKVDIFCFHATNSAYSGAAELTPDLNSGVRVSRFLLSVL
jgi:hypothetical protein